MPKRTNKFQKLIVLIQNSLTNTGKLTESMMLTDSTTGEEREVDIVVEGNFNGIDVILGIECTSRKNPLDITYVDSMIEKHRFLPTNKLIIVSAKGFTKQAENKASLNNIETTTLEDANTKEWKYYLNNLTNLQLGQFEYKIISGNIAFVDHVQLNNSANIWESTTLIIKGRDDPIKFSDYITFQLEQKIGPEVAKLWVKKPEAERKNTFNAEINITPDYSTIAEIQDFKAEVKEINMKVQVTVKTAKVDMKVSKYLTSKVAYGYVQNIGSETTNKNSEIIISIAEDEEGKITGYAFTPKNGYSDGDIMELDFNIDND